MKSREYVALTACSMVLTALGIDIMLPVFGALRVHFNLPPQSTATAQIVMFFFMGQMAQIIFGVMSDRFGRLAILRIGFPLYAIGGIAAAFATSLEWMCAMRFIAGVGASAVFMTSIAGVRDRYVGDEMAKIMSLIFTFFLFTPVFAPFLGWLILSVSNWQIVFLTPPVFAILIFIWSLRLEESLPADKRTVLDWKTIRQSLAQVLVDRSFVTYTLMTTLLFTSLSVYVSSSEHIVGEIYGKPQLFIWLFSGMGLIMSISSFYNSKIIARFGAVKSVRMLMVLYVAIAFVLLACTLIQGDPPSMVVFFIGITALMSVNIAIEPNSSALALQGMGDVAGLASSVYGTAFFLIGSILGSIISAMMEVSVMPLVISFFGLGLVSIFLVFAIQKDNKA
jgi:MFS transporter, DHA1 family, multidrug resistance protein